MPKARVTGVGFGPMSISWEYRESRRDQARRVVVYLEPLRILRFQPYREDGEHCRRSADRIRHEMTRQIQDADGGELEQSLRVMRQACTSFIDAAGADAERFRDMDYFARVLADFQRVMAIEVARIVDAFDLSVEEELLAVLPPQDLDWLPGIGT